MHTPYCHLWPVWLCRIFSQYLTKDTILENSHWAYNVFWYPLPVLPGTFLILIKIGRHIVKNIYWSLCKVSLFLSGFNEIWILLTDFRKILKYQILWELSGRRVVPCGQTDRHNDFNSCFSQYCRAPNNQH